MLSDERLELLLVEDRDPLRVQSASERSRVLAAVDVRDLRGGEGHDIVLLVVAVNRIEVVEVTSGRAHDDGLDWHGILLYMSLRGHCPKRPGFGFESFRLTRSGIMDEHRVLYEEL